MNTRILELLKTPDLIQKEDLNLLNAEIEKQPYIQNIRALYLYGTRKFSPENYQKELSRTAAYTTDKKILYQFINKIQPEVIKESEQTHQTKTETVVETPTQVFESIEPKVMEAPKPVIVNGQVNRILFEGEEDFLERKTEKIDLEATLESGTLVTQQSSQPENIVSKEIPENKTEEVFKPEIVEEKSETEDENQDFKLENQIQSEEISDDNKDEVFSEAANAENFSTEKIIKEDDLKSETEIKTVEDSSELSFHGTEDFLPEVKIAAAAAPTSFSAPKPQTNRHEDEMKRLIAEVEAKVKAAKKDKKPVQKEEQTPLNTEINFAETHDFEFNKNEETEKVVEKAIETTSENNVEKEIPSEEILTETKIETPVNSSWKPMNFAGNTPDSFIAKEEVKKPEIQKIEEPKNEIPVNKESEKPAINISFFGSEVAPIHPKEEVQQEVSEPESNVPGFINTWQNWLKIDRTEPKIEESTPKTSEPNIETEPSEEAVKEEIKNKAIENFIENEPKISKLKEDQQIVVKEKASDLSHLMTETLAKLYLEQKLYAKAVKGYETLKLKHPEKSADYDEKIQEIKELRQK